MTTNLRITSLHRFNTVKPCSPLYLSRDISFLPLTIFNRASKYVSSFVKSGDNPKRSTHSGVHRIIIIYMYIQTQKSWSFTIKIMNRSEMRAKHPLKRKERKKSFDVIKKNKNIKTNGRMCITHSNYKIKSKLLSVLLVILTLIYMCGGVSLTSLWHRLTSIKVARQTQNKKKTRT